MTVSEIEKLEAMLKTETVEFTLSFLADEKLVKQAKAGLVDVSVPSGKGGEPKTVKALPLSANLCVIAYSAREVTGFKNFRSKVNLTHRGTGLNIHSLKLKLPEALRLAATLEGLLNWDFKTVEEFKKQPSGAITEALDLIRTYAA